MGAGTHARAGAPIPRRCSVASRPPSVGAAGPAEDLPRLRLGRRQVVPDVRRGRGGAASAARTSWSPRCSPTCRRTSRADRSDLEAIPTTDVDGVPVIDVARGAGAPAAGLPGRRPGLRQSARQPAPEALPGRRGAARRRHLGHHLDQPRVHRRAAGVRRGRHWATTQPETVPQALHRRAPTKSSSSTRRRRRPTPTSPTDASARRSSAARAAADRRRRRSSARGVPRLHGIQSSWGTQERILVCMTPRANAADDARQRPAQRRSVPRRAVRRST